MKNNKKLTYILIPIVILLWGYIIFKLFFNTDNNINYQKNKRVEMIIDQESDSVFSYQLKLNYRDPFIRPQAKPELEKTENTTSSKINNKPISFTDRRRRASQRSLSWPQVHYFGIINNHYEQTIAIMINSKNYLLQKGESTHGVKVIRCTNDSIILEFEGEEKTYYKN